MCQENQAIVWYNGQSCITLFHFWGTGCARRNVGKFVPYLYRTIFNDKVDYLEVKTLTITQWEKANYKYRWSASIVETLSWRKQSRRGIVVIIVQVLHQTIGRKWNDDRRDWIGLRRRAQNTSRLPMR